MRDQLGSVFLYGRLKSLSRAALSTILVNAGARLLRTPDKADTVAVAHQALDRCVAADGALRLPFAAPPDAQRLSEDAFAARLVAAMQAHPTGGAYTLADVARLTGLPPGVCETLSVFDVIGPGDAPLTYADLAAARQVAALVAQGVAVVAIVRSAWALAGRKIRLSQARLVEAPWGGLVQQVDGRMARLDGQFALVLDEQALDAEATLAAALESEEGGDLQAAERHYRRAVVADPDDPLLSFNLGNVLAALGRPAEAMIAFQQALAKDPAFAEAAFNLAHLVEQSGQAVRAAAFYRDTISAHPDYPQPIYNLARLLTGAGAYRDALPLWERFIALVPGDPDIAHARRSALLCRMEMRRPATGG